MECVGCLENINEKLQNNVSTVFGKPLCEDCNEYLSEDEIDELLQEPYDIS